jgi:hypothetical protein
MNDRQIFTSRLKGRPLLDSEGVTIGRIRDVVILPAAGREPPRALDLEDSLSRLAKLMADQPSPDRSGFRRLPNRRLPRWRVRVLALRSRVLAGRRGREGRAWLCLAWCLRARQEATRGGPALAVGVGLDQRRGRG